nr:hypothetical protein [Parabacteroides goldsteinii]
MNIYVYMIAFGMLVIGLSYYYWVDKRDRKLDKGNPKNEEQQSDK